MGYRASIACVTSVACMVLVLSACGGGGSTIRSNPEESFAHYYNLGIAAFEQQKYNEAIRHFQRSIQLNPEIARSHSELGTCYLLLNQPEKAVASFERALEINPRQTETHNSLGVALMNLQRFDEAERHFNVVLSTTDYPTKFLPYYNLGNIYYQKEDWQRALAFYTQAEAESNNVSTDYRIALLQQIGNVHYELANYAAALEAYEDVLVLSPRLLHPAYRGGICAMHTGNEQRARQLFLKVIAINPESDLADKAKIYLNSLPG